MRANHFSKRRTHCIQTLSCRGARDPRRDDRTPAACALITIVLGLPCEATASQGKPSTIILTWARGYCHRHRQYENSCTASFSAVCACHDRTGGECVRVSRRRPKGSRTLQTDLCCPKPGAVAGDSKSRLRSLSPDPFSSGTFGLARCSLPARVFPSGLLLHATGPFRGDRKRARPRYTVFPGILLLR